MLRLYQRLAIFNIILIPTMETDQIPQFTGLRVVAPAPTDFVAGAETAVPAAPRNDSADWTPEIPDPKGQLMKDPSGAVIGDTESCTDFSGTNAVSTQLDWLIAHGQIDPAGVNFLKGSGYIGADGKVSISPRFTAVMSGTTPQVGNTLPNVGNSLRHDGFVPESLWPMPQFTPGMSVEAAWAEYFAPIPDEVVAAGKRLTSWISTQYQWAAFPGGGAQTPAQFSALLQLAPVQIATAVCPPWNTDQLIAACGAGTQHATTLINVQGHNGAYDILDHYQPWIKHFAPDYTITYGMQYFVSSVPQAGQPPAAFQHTYTVNLALGAPAGNEVKLLQQGLQALKDKTGKPYMAPGVFGPFGPQTEAALGRFQVDHGIADAPQGHDFGPQSRAALTAALSNNH